MSDDDLGPLIRLWGLTTAELPDPSDTPDKLAPFLISILQEAVPFIDSAAPKSASSATAHPAVDPGAAASRLWKPKGPSSGAGKRYPESAAAVHLSERAVRPAELERVARRSGGARSGHRRVTSGETWACRRSVHADTAAPGARSASWAEFRDAMGGERHAESEAAFAPTVVASRPAIVWDCGGVEAVEAGDTWGRFALRVEEIKHRVGGPLVKDRVFPVLQMVCSAMESGGSGSSSSSEESEERTQQQQLDDAAAVSRREKAELLIVSIAVSDFATAAPQAELSRSKGVVVGAYTSVERIRKLPGSGDIEWVMATASNARGALPAWVQALAVPGQIARDVPLFLGWVAKERQRGSGPAGRPPAEAEAGKGKAAAGGTEAPLATSEETAAKDAGAPAEGEPLSPAKDGPSDEPAPASSTLAGEALESPGTEWPASGHDKTEEAASENPAPVLGEAK